MDHMCTNYIWLNGFVTACVAAMESLCCDFFTSLWILIYFYVAMKASPVALLIVVCAGATTEGDTSAAAPNGEFKAQGNDSDYKSEESGDSDNDELVRGRERLGAPLTQLVAGGAV